MNVIMYYPEGLAGGCWVYKPSSLPSASVLFRCKDLSQFDIIVGLGKEPTHVTLSGGSYTINSPTATSTGTFTARLESLPFLSS